MSPWGNSSVVKIYFFILLFLVHSKMKTFLSVTDVHVVPNPYNILLSVRNIPTFQGLEEKSRR